MFDSENKKVFASLFLVVFIFIIAELMLQLRSQWRYGQSIFNVLKGQTTFQYDEQVDLLLLRKNALIKGEISNIQSNELGLRSPPIKKTSPAPFRIVLLGASTVMGTYTKNNEDTWSYQLQRELNNHFKDVEVINAGISGYTIKDQINLYDKILTKLQPDLLVWYAGFNDISGYCNKKSSKKEINAYALQTINYPKWSLLIELAIKNTMMLRNHNFEKNTKLDPFSIDTTNYAKKLSLFYQTMKSNNVNLIPLTMARAFRRDMPVHEQLALSETARYYNACFDVAGLQDVYDIHNSLIVDVGKKYDYQAVKMQELIPGGREHFGDATHFSVKGTKLAAKILAHEIKQRLN